MKRNMTLIVMMMLTSVAAAVASPDQPAHATAVDCFEPQQVAVLAQSSATNERGAGEVTVSARKTHTAEQLERALCTDDITAPYRQLHHGGLKVAVAASGCADSV